MADHTGSSIGVAVITYESEDRISGVLDALAPALRSLPARVLVADDHSSDRTADAARRWASDRDLPVDVVRRDHNLGNGGNQKACIRWAIAEELDVLVLVHGDGQHPVELVPALVEPIVAGRADAVLGSRMLEAGAARRGGMPLRRHVGNLALSAIQNRLAGASVSEWYSGFRAYSVPTLRTIDLARLPDGFDFDPAMIIQLLAVDARIGEIPIPTRYEDEISRVALLTDGLRILKYAVQHRRRRGRPTTTRR